MEVNIPEAIECSGAKAEPLEGDQRKKKSNIEMRSLWKNTVEKCHSIGTDFIEKYK